jgi:hypothetical protein
VSWTGCPNLLFNLDLHSQSLFMTGFYERVMPSLFDGYVSHFKCLADVQWEGC